MFVQQRAKASHSKKREEKLSSRCLLVILILLAACARLCLSRSRRKLTSMSNTLPPINAHARSSLDDVRGDGSGEPAGNALGTKHHQLRRQQPVDRNRRSPLRSNPLVTSTNGKYATTTSPFASNTSLVRSSSIVQSNSGAQVDSTRGKERRVPYSAAPVLLFLKAVLICALDVFTLRAC